MNHRGLGECTPTSCPKAGIKIHESNNNYNNEPFVFNNKSSQLTKPVNFNKTTLDSLDLDLDHYSLEDLCKLLYNNNPDLEIVVLGKNNLEF